MNILISGGTGLIGKALRKLLEKEGHQVAILSRSGGDISWNPAKNWMQENALDQIDAIVHLAGENIGSKPWTEKRKAEIIDSRVKSTELLINHLQTHKNQVKTVVFASAIGFYGADSGELLCTEDSPAGNDFLATCTKAWENASKNIPSSIRAVTLRIGLVLDKEEGIFPKIAAPIKWGIGSALGSGKQWQSWIHIDDLCQFFLQAIENPSLKGIYNAVGPSPIRQNEMAKIIAKVMHRPYFFPAVPAFALKFLLGEMSCLVLGGNQVSCNKFINETNYRFKFASLEEAISQLIKDV